MDETSSQTHLNEKTFWLVSCALVSGMLTCASVTLISLFERLLPDWQPVYLVGLVFFVSFERLYTYQRFLKLSLFSKEWIITHATEWVVILMLVKIAVGMSHGMDKFLAEIPNWVGGFSRNFFSPDFLFATGLVVATWFLSANFAELLEELGLKQSLILQQFPALQAETQPARERLLGSIISLGTLLIILTALIRVDLRAVFLQTKGPAFIQLPALGGGGASTLLYFMLGLALLSQTQFMDLFVRWRIRNIPVSSEISRNWTIYSLIFFALLVAGVSFLPTNYSLGLLTYLGYFLGIIAGLIYFVYQVVIALLLFLLSLPFVLLGYNSLDRNNSALIPPRLPRLPAQSPVGAPPPAWFELAKSLFFWVILALILVYSIIQYLRQHKEIFQAMSRIPGFRLLVRSWLWLSEQFKQGRIKVVKLLERGRERLQPSSEDKRVLPGSGFINLRRLDPRQKITFFYLALLRRAEENGLARRASQTPREYATRLDSAMPGLEDEIDSLTEAFVEVRYSHHPIATDRADRVRSTWERIKKALRNIRSS